MVLSWKEQTHRTLPIELGGFCGWDLGCFWGWYGISFVGGSQLAQSRKASIGRSRVAWNSIKAVMPKKDYTCAEHCSLTVKKGSTTAKVDQQTGGSSASHKNADALGQRCWEETFTWRNMSDTVKARTPSNAKIWLLLFSCWVMSDFLRPHGL